MEARHDDEEDAALMTTPVQQKWGGAQHDSGASGSNGTSDSTNDGVSPAASAVGTSLSPGGRATFVADQGRDNENAGATRLRLERNRQALCRARAVAGHAAPSRRRDAGNDVQFEERGTPNGNFLDEFGSFCFFLFCDIILIQHRGASLHARAF